MQRLGPLLLPREDAGGRQHDPFQGAKAFHLLWALMFLKLYTAECVLASIAAVDEKSYRKWAWAFVDAVADLHTQVVSSLVWNSSVCAVLLTPPQMLWSNRFKATDLGAVCKVSVDGTDIRIFNWKPLPFLVGFQTS